MTHIEAMKQALEALENLLYWDNSKPEYDEAREAITSLRQAIATEESSATQKPVAFITNRRQRMNVELKPNAFVWMPTTTDWEIPLYTHPQPKTEQEPKREWVGLTLKDLPDEHYGNVDFGRGANWAEAKLKEKNT